MCGSSSSNTQSQNYSTNYSTNSFDPWVTSAGKDLYGQAQDWMGKNGYQSYSGPLTASFGEPFNQATTYLSSLLGKDNPYTTQAAGATQGVIGAIDPNASIQSYMSPYTQSVLRPQLDAILQSAGEQGQANDAAATMAGAYGGTGAGVVRALLNKNTQQQIANTTGAAYDAAFKNAQQSRLSNLQTLLSGGSQLSSIGQQAFGQGTTLASLLAGLGTQQQQAGQQGITNAMTLNKQDNTLPFQQYSMLASVLGGIPKNSSQFSTGMNMGNSTTSQPNNSGWSALGSIIGMFL